MSIAGNAKNLNMAHAITSFCVWFGLRNISQQQILALEYSALIEQDCIKNQEQRVEATTFFFFLLFAATFIWNLLR